MRSLSYSGLSERTVPHTTGRELRYQGDDDNRLLRNVLLSRQCLWQLLLTVVICGGVHTLMGWGSLSNWSQHDLVSICLTRWAHPAGYKAMGTALVEEVPVDAILTAFFACLGAMKRTADVQRGSAPHVPPDALHRGPLWFLFPRGVEALPRLSSLLGVTIVWGALFTGGILGGLAIAYCTNKHMLCLSGWDYTVARTIISTTEATLVSAGSYLLWCSKAEDLAARSLVDRARLRREVEDEEKRKAAATFGVFQVFGAAVAVVVLAITGWTVLLGCGSIASGARAASSAPAAGARHARGARVLRLDPHPPVPPRACHAPRPPCAPRPP